VITDAILNGSFTTAVDLSASPSTQDNREVAVQNLFFLNNVIHDELYRHGFTEPAGNFQQNNFVGGGRSRDPMRDRRTGASAASHGSGLRA